MPRSCLKRRSGNRVLLFLALAGICLNVPLGAQQRSSAAIYGTVTDSQGAVVAAARV
jgi:hypothetical protein